MFSMLPSRVEICTSEEVPSVVQLGLGWIKRLKMLMVYVSDKHLLTRFVELADILLHVGTYVTSA